MNEKVNEQYLLCHEDSSMITCVKSLFEIQEHSTWYTIFFNFFIKF